MEIKRIPTKIIQMEMARSNTVCASCGQLVLSEWDGCPACGSTKAAKRAPLKCAKCGADVPFGADACTCGSTQVTRG